jgi:hypothetical protein
MRKTDRQSRSAASDGESVDGLRREMLEIGEQLLAELARESKLAMRRPKRSEAAAVLEEWRASRASVDTLAEAYLRALVRYRQAMAKTIPVWPKSGPRGGASH